MGPQTGVSFRRGKCEEEQTCGVSGAEAGTHQSAKLSPKYPLFSTSTFSPGSTRFAATCARKPKRHRIRINLTRAPRDGGRGGRGRTWSQPRVPEPAMMNGCAACAKRTSRIMRMQSPNTGMKSGEMWLIDGCAFAYSTCGAGGRKLGGCRTDESGGLPHLIGDLDGTGDAAKTSTEVQRASAMDTYTSSLYGVEGASQHRRKTAIAANRRTCGVPAYTRGMRPSIDTD